MVIRSLAAGRPAAPRAPDVMTYGSPTAAAAAPLRKPRRETARLDPLCLMLALLMPTRLQAS
jgi:hypothetical protein